MSKGTLWSAGETAIIRDNLDKTPAVLRKLLRQAGYEREYFSISNKRLCMQKPKIKDRVKLKFGGTSYKKVLDAEQQKKAEHFLRCLKTTNRKATEAGLEVDVMGFLNAYACEYGKNGDMAERFALTDYRKQSITALHSIGDSPYLIAQNIGLTTDKVCRYLREVDSVKGAAHV